MNPDKRAAISRNRKHLSHRFWATDDVAPELEEHVSELTFEILPPPSRQRERHGVVPMFARHETFHPRYGWIKKGFDAAESDVQTFLQDDASVVLGVGKNMVRAIRYWCHATKVLTEASGARRSGSAPTEFGRRLLGRDGLDPYLENLGSLWLLHWRLLEPPCMATAWHFVFNVFMRQEFTVDELNAALVDYVAREFAIARLASSSLRKDASCIARMYADTPTAAALGEDTIQCPFTELGLLRVSSAKTFAFNIGPKPGLTSELITAAALDFAARSDGGARTVSLSTLLHAPGSPGTVFKLTETALYSALEEAASLNGSLGLADTAGLVQLSFAGRPMEIAWQLVRSHYRRSRTRGLAK